MTTQAWGPFSKGLLATGMVLAFEDQFEDPAQAETVEDKPLGKISKYGDWAGRLWPNLIYVTGALGAGYFQHSSRAYARAVHMALASLYSATVTQALKYTIREPRPNNHSSRESFPSGHTTTAFAFASVVGIQHGWMWGVPAYVMATFVGYSRMNDNKHFLHDVVAGAAIGMGYGLGLYYRLNEKNKFSFYENKIKLEEIFISKNEEGGDSLRLLISY